VKKLLLWLLCFWLGCSASAFSQPVNIVLQDASIVSGDMLGANETSIFLNEKGKAREIPLSDVKEVFEAGSHKPLKLSQLSPGEPVMQEAAPAFAPTPEAVQIRPTRHRQQPDNPAPAAVQISNSWLLMDFGLDFGMGPDNGQVVQLWSQLVPSQCNREINRYFMGFDTDFMVKIFDFWSIGPFFNWMFMSPGLNSSLVYSGGGYWVYYGGYWYYYDYGHKQVDYSLDFNNITYGVATRFNFISEPNASIYVQVNAGYMDLAGGYEVRVDSTRRQRADFEGRCPYTRVLFGLDAGDRIGRVGVQLGYQKALMKNISAKIVQNDYFPQEENTTVPVRDSRDGSNIQVDFSGPIFMFYGSLNF
jgi:hypothetical protein